MRSTSQATRVCPLDMDFRNTEIQVLTNLSQPSRFVVEPQQRMDPGNLWKMLAKSELYIQNSLNSYMSNV